MEILERESALKLPKIPSLKSQLEYSLKVVTLQIEYADASKKGRVKVNIDNECLNVELAVTKIFKALGYDVLRGDEVHLASHCLTDKFMGLNDNETFRNWARINGYGKDAIDSVIKKGNLLFEKLTGGDPHSLSPLLDNLKERWNMYYATYKEKNKMINIFTEFLKGNEELADKWIRWYSSLSYDPAGSPDLFIWNRRDNSWHWVEVKSSNDNLHKIQWSWIEGFLTNVANNVYLVRLLPYAKK